MDFKITRENSCHRWVRFQYFNKLGLPDLKLKKDVGPHKDINGSKKHWLIKKYILKPQSDYPEKIIVAQLLEEVREGSKVIRLGYYIVGKNGNFILFNHPEILFNCLFLLFRHGWGHGI